MLTRALRLPFPALLLLWLGLLGAGCQPHSATMPATAPDPAAPAALGTADGRFDLSATPSTPRGYPATITEARFITPDGGSFPVPYGHYLEGSWGGGGTYWAVGPDQKLVPDSLEIRWFSYPEDQFYEGHFLLPHARLLALLRRGLWDAETKSQYTYGTLDVTVIPTGGVVVWLSAGQSDRVLIGRYQARPIDFDFKSARMPFVDRAIAVADVRAKLAPEVRRAIATHSLSSKQWDDYLKTYPWKLEFSRPLKLYDYSFEYLNAEATGDPPSPDLATHAQLVLAPSLKPVPSSAMLYVAGAYGRKRLLRIVPFDEHQTQGAFQELAARHPGQVISLYVETDERLSQAALSLRAGGQVIALTKTHVQLFDPE